MMKLTRIFDGIILERSTQIITSDRFIQDISNWVERPSKIHSDRMMKYKGQIPDLFRKSATLYRGINLTDEQYDMIRSGKSIKSPGVRSWSHDKNVAIKFLTDEKYQINKSKPNKVLIAKKIGSDQILIDIYHYFLYMKGSSDHDWDDLVEDSIMKEKEVLCYDVEVSKKDIVK